MPPTKNAEALLKRLDKAKPLNTELRSIAKEQGKNHELAAELWKHGGFSSRMLSLLILDLKSMDIAHIRGSSLTSRRWTGRNSRS